jgi:hypothetical protein
MPKLNKIYVYGLVTLLFCLIPLGSAQAESSISYPYKAELNLKVGYIVGLINKKSNYVQPASTTQPNNLIGIVTSNQGSIIQINPSAQTTQVAISGAVPVLVSTLNGNIKPNDLISLSPIAGVGMKANNLAPIIGVAEGSFNSNTPSATSLKVDSVKNVPKTVSVGYVLVMIKFKNLNINSSKATQLHGLQAIIKNLTGHSVPLIRIIISLVLSVLSIIVLGVIIYSVIFNAVIAVGRNPLAKASIRRSLILTVSLAIILAIVTIVVVSLLLS